MTPEDRFAAHEQWLLDHDRRVAEHEDWIARIREIQEQQADIQRRQSAVLLEIAEHMARLLDRENPQEPRA